MAKKCHRRIGDKTDMALTRKFLAALGIESEKIDEIIDAHTETVNALKKERDDAKAEVVTFKADAEKLPSVQQELDDLKAANADNPYKEKYEKEHQEFEKYKSEVTAKETKQKKEFAYRAILKEAGVSEKRIDSIIKVSAVDEVELDDDGKIKDADKMKENIKTEWSDFIVKEGAQGADTKTPPPGDGKDSGQLSRAAMVAQKHYEAIYGNGKGESK